MLYTDTAVVTVGNRNYLEKPIGLIRIYKNISAPEGLSAKAYMH
jgi:hypothetical protein